MKDTSAPEADGWRVAELQALPLLLFEKLAELLNLLEETGTWPVPLTRGLWASLRVRDIMHWQEIWADTTLHAYRTGKRAGDVWMDLSLSVESALVDGSD